MQTLPKYKSDFTFTSKALTFEEDKKLAEFFPEVSRREQITDLSRYILCKRRVTKSKAQDEFIKFLMDEFKSLGLLPTTDEYGNLYVDVLDDAKDSSRVMFTSHVDIVGVPSQIDDQDVHYDATARRLFKTDGQTLGADDGVGVYVMWHMIKSAIPGFYAFFKDEECGRVGSQRAHIPMIKEFDYCISFDRGYTTDIITHQSPGRGCSDEFANALSKAFGDKLKPNANGVFTDSASFFKDVAECTNISVGYYNQHGGDETQCVDHFFWLLDAVLKVKWSELPVKRDPKVVEPKQNFFNSYDCDDYDWWHDRGYKPGKPKASLTDKQLEKLDSWLGNVANEEAEEFANLLRTAPNLIAAILLEHGYDYSFFEDEIIDATGGYN